ncbi:hypothetical protein [Pendulispora albinea]|uniref:Uncharacterized protein n=1 Tax=Pendulispora albinea TaxID=2741071 RepID=A0ABZ2M1Y4_9BACT
MGEMHLPRQDASAHAIPSVSQIPPISVEHYDAERARLCRIGAACAVLNIAAQVFQAIANRFLIPEANSAVEAIQVRSLSIEHVRATVMLLSLLLLLAVFAATAFDRVRRAPVAALVGFASMLLLIGFELACRSIDLFAISQHWAREYLSAHDEALRQMVIERIAQWDAAVNALYFPAVLTYALGSACFALSLRGERGAPARLGSIAWTLNAIRLGLRTVGFAEIDALNRFLGAIYFPATVVMYGLLAIWLWSAAKTRRVDNLGRRMGPMDQPKSS